MLCRTLTQKNVDNDFRRHHGEATLPNTFFDPTIAPHHPVGTAVVPETFEFQLREFAATPSAHVASSQLSPTTQLRCRKQTCPQKETVGHVCTMHMSTQIHRPWRSLTADKPTRTTTATTTTTTTKKRLPQPNETKRQQQRQRQQRCNGKACTLWCLLLLLASCATAAADHHGNTIHTHYKARYLATADTFVFVVLWCIWIAQAVRMTSPGRKRALSLVHWTGVGWKCGTDAINCYHCKAEGRRSFAWT